VSAEVVDLTPDPRQAREAEVGLLGVAMAGGVDLDELLDTVSANDFYQPQHADIWTAIGNLHRKGIAPEMVAVADELMATAPIVRGVKRPAATAIDLHTMVNIAPLSVHAEHYADLVVRAAGFRNLQAAGTRVQQIAIESDDLEDARENARAAIDQACAGRSLSRARMLADLIDDVLHVAENGTADALSTGWPDVDRLIGGVAPGRLIVIGARPGVGKSLAGTNLALHVAHRLGHAVLISSLEMPEREVGQRLLAAHASVGLTGIQTGTVPASEWARISERYAEIAEMPISVDDAPGQTISTIRSAARNLQRKRDDLALIVVDYLQLVRPSERRANRAEEVAEISRGLKLLARETGACVVAMAQLNREAAKGDGKPRLTDLRESGAIEADADQVILMHQPDDEIPELELLVDKNRHGPRGTARLQVAGHYAQLRSVAWSPSGAIR
jgi:replicative DNA helicase